MPLHVQPPMEEHEFLDWVLDRAIECIEDGRDASAEELMSLRPELHERVRELVELARRVGFGPKAAKPNLPGYTLIELIGEGGMGSVWLARQENLGGRLVAVKMLPRSLGLSPKLRSRFRTEAQAIAKLRHPHIVNVYDVIEGDGVQAYAMEWVEGTTFAGVIERAKGGDVLRHGLESSMGCVRDALGAYEHESRGPLDRSYIVFVCRIGAAIARALSAVHRAGLVHRDIKPSNILLRRDGTPLLSDFGLVRDPDSSVVTQAGADGGTAFAGTVSFAAPEQLRIDSGEVDPRSDIYSLGITLYFALGLRLPFAAQHPVDLLRQIELGLAEPLRKINPKLPRDLQTIVAKAIQPEPSQRYQTADELADDLDRLMSLQPIRARPAGWMSRAWKLARRNRTVLVAAVLGGGLAIGLMVLGLVYFLGFPAWSAAHLNEARLVLVDPEQSNSMFASLTFGVSNASGRPISLEAVTKALEHYDAAARFAPFDRDIALERDLVMLAREITHRPAPAAVTFNTDTILPLTAAYAALPFEAWRDEMFERKRVFFSTEQWESATDQDLRGLGLLAMLCSDPDMTTAAWTAFDMRGSSDALVEASFGIAFLIRKEYGRAYPRLRKAVEAFPNVGFLLVYLAEVAMHCGDLDKAQHWLDQAKTMPRLDRFNGWKRVQAGLYAASGQPDDARRLYEELMLEDQNIVAFDDYARFLEAQGDLERVLLVYLRIIGFGSNYMGVYERFVKATERWWVSLDTAEQTTLLQSSEPWSEQYRMDREGILAMYGLCRTRLGLPPTSGGVPSATSVSEPN